MGLYQMLSDYAGEDVCPMHMPGHKRRALHGPDLPWHLDISEIGDFDNLHAPEGIFLEAEERAARLWGSGAAHLLINGSTGGLLAGIYTLTRPGDVILMARNCHKAVYHAVELFGLSPVYLDPPTVAGTGIPGSVSPAEVGRIVAARPDIRLVVLTSPTYEGVLSDVGAIGAVLRGHGIPLFVDEAHGAHLGLSAHFPPSAISQGADLVQQSIHKTLPSLTQTAILHLRAGVIPPERMRHALGLFQSTSPSYPLLASIDGCVALMRDRGEELLGAWRARLEAFYQTMGELRHLRLLTGDTDSRHIYAHDPGKLTIITEGTPLSGRCLLAAMREQFGIELEMAQDGYALAMTSLANTEAHFTRLGYALRQIDGRCESAPPRPAIALPPMPEQAIPAGEALRLLRGQMAFADSVGRISGAYIWVYPPGVPIVTPGSRITAEVAECLKELTDRGVVLRSTYGTVRGLIEVVDNP